MNGEDDGSRLDRAVAAVPGWIYRAVGALCFAGFLAHRMSTRATYANQGLFWLEAAIPTLILVAYLTRPEPKRRARGAAAILLPFVASALPLGLLGAPRTPFGLEHQDVILVTLCFPTALMVWGYVALNRSFSIMAEARELKTGGPYRWVRHPVYTGQILCGLVVLVWRFSLVGLGLWLLFTWVQSRRASAEEEALLAAFPSYSDYMDQVPRGLPRV